MGSSCKQVATMWYYWLGLLKYLLYRVARFIFYSIRGRWWHLAGITEHIDDIRMSGLIYKSAHVQKIVYKQTWGNLFSASGESEFITLHQSFKDPDYILQDRVLLYKITGSAAIFVETAKEVAKGGILLTKEELFRNAKKLIILPMRAFHYVASQIKMPGNLAMVGAVNTDNIVDMCGQFFLDNQSPKLSTVQGHVALPDSCGLEDIFQQKQLLAPDQYFKTLQHGIAVLFKSLQEKYTYVITLQGQYVAQALDVLHIMPHTRCLFLPDVDGGQKLTQMFMQNIDTSSGGSDFPLDWRKGHCYMGSL